MKPECPIENLPLHWQMCRWEKYTIDHLLDIAKPDVSIEIGTYKGGSLQLISKKSKKVYSIDINGETQNALRPHFDNVEFLIGDSKDLLPKLVEDVHRQAASVNFVLIDGCHTEQGVRDDINAVLKLTPIGSVYIVCHDSFNPFCRRGIQSANWKSNPYVHYVEVDYVPGIYHYNAYDTAESRSMYGGLAVAVMSIEKRNFELSIGKAQEELFKIFYPHSCHYPQ